MELSQNTQFSADLPEFIAKSKAFPIPFPIETVRIEQLQARRPVERLKKNIVSTYPLLHERLLILMTRFLDYKREYGSGIEKELYKEMGVPEFIDRLLKKRAVCFVGARDKYVLLSGKDSSEGWELVGTPQQRPPLVLADCLSYDEMKLSAMLFVSGPTECINDGTRRNSGLVKKNDIEPHGIIIGAIGTRLKRLNRMECEDMLITQKQNCAANGYGAPSGSLLGMFRSSQVKQNEYARRKWREMWDEFYSTSSQTFDEISKCVTTNDTTPEQRYSDRYVNIIARGIFDNEVFCKRVNLIAETVLLEADARARDEGRDAFVNVIGCGLGVWSVSDHQADVYVLAWMERARHLLSRNMLRHISDINFAYIKVTDSLLAHYATTSGNGDKNETFFKHEGHPRGGINILWWDREPSSCLSGVHEGKLLVMTYPWDGNAHPGNEFWYGNLKGSGDSAAACATQVSELHNAHINCAVAAQNARVATVRGDGLNTLPAYCKSVMVESALKQPRTD